MKKFKFYALAFAAIAFAGCSDDVIDGQGANTGVQGDAAPAYLTISFSANGNSSRAAGEPGDDTNNQGDQDGKWEDSGHHNDGTAAENEIKDALVVVAPAEGGTVGFAKLYSTSVDSDLSKPEGNEEGGFNIVDKNSTTYYNPDPIKVAVGKYNVLVVVNPVSALTETLQNNELTNLNDVNELYNKIVNQEYKKVDTENGSAPDYEAPTYIDAVSELVPQTTGEGDDLTPVKGIMMANKSLNADAPTQGYSVELTEANTPENPAPVTIDVERVLSKITFRETKMKDFDGNTELDANVYPVKFVTGVAEPITEEGAINNNGTYEVKTFCLAQDSYEPANDVYALYDENEDFVGVYQKTDKEDANNKTGKPIFEKLTAVSSDTYKNEKDEEKKKGYFVAVDKDNDDTFSDEEQENSIILQNREGTGDTHEYYVKLEGYALVNLSKSVFYVRHTTDASGLAQPFGTLKGDNFLYTPFWQKKNEINVEEASAFTGLGDIFYNTLAAVSTESESLAIDNEGALSGNTLYKAISTLGADQGTSNTQHGTVPTTGKFMAYCFENSTDVAHQVHGLSTGISFVATVWKDATCTQPIDRLYLYSNHTFESLHAIQDAYGSHLSTAFEALLAKETVNDQGEVTASTVTKDDLIALAEGAHEEITMYNGNTCYYYTTEIKHFDNGKPTELGNMEFAIMRNNIYSLAVTEISTIGAPFVDPTPNTENESSEAALKVTVQMEPWIVRYSDIEF